MSDDQIESVETEQEQNDAAESEHSEATSSVHSEPSVENVNLLLDESADIANSESLSHGSSVEKCHEDKLSHQDELSHEEPSPQLSPEIESPEIESSEAEKTNEQSSLDLSSEAKTEDKPDSANDGSKEAQTQVVGNKAQPVQEEMPFALVNGLPFNELPKDLYIPPDALEVFLEAFEGPLDLLLYLIRRQNVDISNIPIANITEQYMQYVEVMKTFNLELAAEYLVMAAVLCEIKSRVLLPRPKSEEEEENDPRADLIRRLQEYERFKKAAEDIDEMPRVGRDIFEVDADQPELNLVRPQPDIDLKELLLAFKDVLVRADMFTHHQIQKETLSVREKMANVLAILSSESFTDFITLFSIEEGRMGVVVTFLAIMELSKETLIELVQTDAFGPIHVRARSSSHVSEVDYGGVN